MEQQIITFLQKNEMDAEPIQWLAGDASLRHYARIYKKGNSFILMSSPQSEKPQSFYDINLLLEKNGLSVPHIYAADIPNGLMILEDLGQDTYTSTLNKEPQKAKMLYENAIDALIKVQQIDELRGIPNYDFSWWKTALSVFLDYYFPYFENKKLDTLAQSDFWQIWEKLFVKVKPTCPVIILNDFIAANLIELPARKGFQSCALLDFQDAMVGHQAYDLVSLLDDIRGPKVLDENLKAHLFSYYINRANIEDHQAFETAYHILALKRLIRILGYFIRLKVRDNKPKYMDYLPAIIALIHIHLNQRGMEELKAWMSRFVFNDSSIEEKAV